MHQIPPINELSKLFHQAPSTVRSNHSSRVLTVFPEMSSRKGKTSEPSVHSQHMTKDSRHTAECKEQSLPSVSGTRWSSTAARTSAAENEKSYLVNGSVVQITAKTSFGHDRLQIKAQKKKAKGNSSESRCTCDRKEVSLPSSCRTEESSSLARHAKRQVERKSLTREPSVERSVKLGAVHSTPRESQELSSKHAQRFLRSRVKKNEEHTADMKYASGIETQTSSHQSKYRTYHSSSKKSSRAPTSSQRRESIVSQQQTKASRDEKSKRVGLATSTQGQSTLPRKRTDPTSSNKSRIAPRSTTEKRLLDSRSGLPSSSTPALRSRLGSSPENLQSIGQGKSSSKRFEEANCSGHEMMARERRAKAASKTSLGTSSKTGMAPAAGLSAQGSGSNTMQIFKGKIQIGSFTQVNGDVNVNVGSGGPPLKYEGSNVRGRSSNQQLFEGSEVNIARFVNVNGNLMLNKTS